MDETIEVSRRQEPGHKDLICHVRELKLCGLSSKVITEEFLSQEVT